MKKNDLQLAKHLLEKLTSIPNPTNLQEELSAYQELKSDLDSRRMGGSYYSGLCSQSYEFSCRWDKAGILGYAGASCNIRDAGLPLDFYPDYLRVRQYLINNLIKYLKAQLKEKKKCTR